MTGRRLYELFCDGWAKSGSWQRSPGRGWHELGLPSSLPAWPFLSGAEQRIFNSAASRIKGVKR